jgi:hypothetical protein
MSVQINDLVIEVPPPSNQPQGGASAASGGAGASTWTSELARKVDQQLRIALERQQRVVTD